MFFRTAHATSALRTSFHALALLGALSLVSAGGTATATERWVSSDWLEDHLSDPDVRILDARQPADYQSEHIPGAVNLPESATFGQAPHEDMLAPISTIQSLFEQAGIRPGDHVIVYDDGRFLFASRLFWVLETFGHEKVSVLNAGFARWKESGHRVSDKPVTTTASSYPITVRPNRMATKLATLVGTRSDKVQIIDARGRSHYQGKESITPRFGHIPSAVNIPVSETLVGEDVEARFKPLDELARMYSSIDPSKPVITYCSKGRQASMTYLVLRSLGYEPAVYDGSWFEWSRDAALPIEETGRGS